VPPARKKGGADLMFSRQSPTDCLGSRYPVGADAEFLISASRSRTDREMDDMVLAMYRSFTSQGR
jgi:hypothetical protein